MMDHIPLIRDIMRAPSRALGLDMDIYEGMALLRSNHATALPVQDEQGHLVGILTEKDCLRVLSHNAYNSYHLMAGGAIKEYMSPVKTVLTTDMDLFRATSLFLETNFTNLPVLEEDQLVGCVSRQDMLQAIIGMQKKLMDGKTKSEAYLKTLNHPESLGDMMVLVGTQSKEQLVEVLSKRHLNQ